jgi:hypothetical protein
MMAEATVIYWRDIPTQVVVGPTRGGVKRQLAQRFMVAVDKAAMESGGTSADDYLEDWRKVATTAADIEPNAAADLLVQELEEAYPATRLAELARHGGKEFLE